MVCVQLALFQPLENQAWAPLIVILLALLLGLALHSVLIRVLRQRADGRAGEASPLAKAVLTHGHRPLRILLPLFAAAILLPSVLEPQPRLERLLAVVLIATMAWAAIAASRVALEVLGERFRMDVADNLQARKIHTQIDLVRKIFVVVVVVVAGALVLMSFEPFRVMGTGLLASAGLAGLILGLAAQSTLGNLLAGFQIALTQPIRLDDVVVVEGEWGRIEEITLTYVVVRIWDLRRLVLPISHFIERPFQNWTRTSAAVLGTVFLHVDYTVPVEEVRRELRTILEGSDLWDGNVCVLHVTEVRDRTVELRALMSAADSGSAWGLRCKVRERLLEYIQREHPGTLPRLRAELTSDSSPPHPSAGQMG